MKQKSIIFNTLMDWLVKNRKKVLPVSIDDERIKEAAERQGLSVEDVGGFYSTIRDDIVFHSKHIKRQAVCEEFFHAMQYEFYKTNPRKVQELEAEAKLFNNVVLLEIMLFEENGYIIDKKTLEQYFFKSEARGTEIIKEFFDFEGDSYIVLIPYNTTLNLVLRLAFKDNNGEITSHTESATEYFDYLIYFEQNNPDGPYSGSQRKLLPEAYNLILNKSTIHE